MNGIIYLVGLIVIVMAILSVVDIARGDGYDRREEEAEIHLLGGSFGRTSK